MFIEITASLGSGNEPRFINVNRIHEVRPYKETALVELVSEDSSTTTYVTTESYNEVIRKIKAATIK